MNYVGLNFYDTANGDGIRVSLFVAGCRMHCKGCFNQESWPFDAGKPFTSEEERQIIEHLSSPYVAGFSLLGGEPFEPEHEIPLLSLLASIKAHFPDKTIWAWTGHKYEDVKKSPLMRYIDVLIDGAFVERIKLNSQEAKGKYYGSSNQRVIPINHEF